MQNNQNYLNYDLTTIVLHWSVAIITLLLWFIGQTADLISNKPINNGIWSIHVLMGFVLTLLLVWRILWRIWRGRRLPPANTGIIQAFAKLIHFSLYGLLGTVVLLGVVNAFVRGYSLFWLFDLPQVGDRTLRKPITEWHGLIANILLGVVFIHAGAALLHHYLWRDNILRRMLPIKRHF